MRKLLAALLLLSGTVYAQTSVKFRNVDAYMENGIRQAHMHDFQPRIPATVAERTLTASVGATLTWTAGMGGCPIGVAGADVGHYLYISGGTGTAESVLITGGTCTSGAASGTITFTPANNHSGTWTIRSATGGISEAISALGSAGGVVDATGHKTTQTIRAIVAVGQNSGPVAIYLRLGSVSYTIAATPGFRIARSSQLHGTGANGGTILNTDNVADRTIIETVKTNNSEADISISNLELRLNRAGDVGFDGETFQNGSMSDIKCNKIGGGNAGTCFNLTAASAATRNYRGTWKNIQIDNVTTGILLAQHAASGNAPDAHTFVGVRCNEAGNCVNISGNVSGTTFAGINIEHSATGVTGFTNAGDSTTVINLYCEGWTTGISNTGHRLSITNPVWGTNAANVSDTGTETYCHACSNGTSLTGNQNSWYMGGTGSWAFGTDRTMTERFNFWHTAAAAAMNIGSNATGNAANTSRLDFYFNNSAASKVRFGYLAVGSSTITAASEAATVSLVGLGSGAGRTLFECVGVVCDIPQGTKIGGGTQIVKYYSATAAINFGAIAANTCVDGTVTVTGVTLTSANTATVGPLVVPVAGVSLSAFVSGADTVTVRACNSTTGAAGAYSTTFRVGVFVH